MDICHLPLSVYFEKRFSLILCLKVSILLDEFSSDGAPGGGGEPRPII